MNTTRQIDSIHVGPIGVDRRYDRQRKEYVTHIQVGRITVLTSEIVAAHNELWLANLETTTTTQ